MSDPLLSMLDDAASLFPGASASVSEASLPPVLRDRGVSVSDTGTPPSKLYSIVKLDRSTPGICFGMVRNGHSFCFRVDCKTKYHMENKVSWPKVDADVMIVIQRPTPFTAFLDPVLAWARIPTAVWVEWQTKSMTLSDWSKGFRAVESGDNLFASKADFQETSLFMDKAEQFRTPLKRGRDPLDNGPFGEDWEFVPHDPKLPKDPVGLDQAIREGVSKEFLTTTLSLLETSVVTMGGALEEVAKVTLGRFVANEKDAMLMAEVIQAVKSNLGSTPNTLQDKFVAPTLWGTTACIADEVDRVGTSLMELGGEILPFKRGMLELIRTTNPKETKEKGEQMMALLDVLMNHMKNLSPAFESLRMSVMNVVEEKRDLDERVGSLELSRNSSRSSKKTRWGPAPLDSVDDLMDMMSDNTFNPPRGDPGMEENEERESEDGEFKSMIERRFEGLDQEISAIRSSGDASTVKFGELGFKTVSDCHDWAIANFPGRRYGLIMDPLLMLDKICGGGSKTSSDASWRNMELKIKLKITTGAEAAALDALNNVRPRLFHTGEASIEYVRNTSRLSKLLKHTSWESGGGGVRAHILKKMNHLHATITADIRTAFGGNPMIYGKAFHIATLSLTHTMTSLTQLVGAMDAIYKQLHLQSKFSSESAWCLTMQILDKICEELFAPKAGVLEGFTLGDPDSVCAHVLYGSFRSQDIMAGYVEHDFENHPSVSTEYIKFLATNSGSEKVEKMAESMICLKELTSKASAKADTASTKVAALTADLTAAIRRVKALEDRARA